MNELAAMDLRVEKLEALAAGTGDRLESIDRHLDAIQGQLAKMDGRLSAIETRTTAVETRLTKVEVKQEEFTRYYATKADLLEVKNSIIMWVVSAFLLAQLLPGVLKKFGL